MKSVAREKRNPTPWYAHIGLVLLVAILAFVVNQLPLVLSPRPLSLGAEGEGPFHIAIEMKLRDPSLFSKDVGLEELIMPSRPLTDRWIHHTVISLGDVLFDGNLTLSNIVIFWMYYLLFITGCYILGTYVLGSSWGGWLFAIASIVPSRGLFDWWGMVYGGGVIPHVLILTIVPWFVWGFLKWASHPWYLLALFSLLGLSANVYALQPLYLFIVLFAVALTDKPGWKWSLTWALAFCVTALPAIYAAAKLMYARPGSMDSSSEALVNMLLVRHYGYATFRPWLTTIKGIVRSPIWLFLAVSAGALWLKRKLGHPSPADSRLTRFAIVTLALVLAWMIAARFTLEVVPLLIYRASSFLYMPAYLGSLWLVLHWIHRRSPGSIIAGLVVLCLILSNGVRQTALYSAAEDQGPIQTSQEFYQLCDWARTTPMESLFMISPTGYHFFTFRVYAERAVTMHYVLGETAISVPQNAHLYWDMTNDVERAYTSRDPATFVDIAHKYQVDYIIDTDVHHPLDLSIVFHNDMFIVYAVPDKF
jgi:hypothetical protein